MSEPTWELLGGGGVSVVDYVGAWAAGTTYSPGQVVRYQGNDYLAVNPSIGSTPPAPATLIPLTGASYGTTLPVTPFDGQEHILVDSITNPTYHGVSVITLDQARHISGNILVAHIGN